MLASRLHLELTAGRTAPGATAAAAGAAGAAAAGDLEDGLASAFNDPPLNHRALRGYWDWDFTGILMG